MPFTFKLSRRMARFRPWSPLVLGGALVSLACAGIDAASPSAPEAPFVPSTPSTPAVPTVDAVEVLPSTATVPASDSVRLQAHGRTEQGDSVPLAVTWEVPAGAAISAEGMFVASVPGTYQVVGTSATLARRKKADTAIVVVTPPPSPAAECAAPKAGWIWCDDFEQDRLARYFEYASDGGSFMRAGGVGKDGSYGMRGRFAAGQVSAGALHLAFGRTPQAKFRPVDAGTANYRELYWRFYVKHEAGWTGGGGNKLTRAFIFASPDTWAQAMIAHVWSGGKDPSWNYLILDPASGTDASGKLVTTTYNDFANLRWLGKVQGRTPMFDGSHVGSWYCVESHVRLNDAGQSNGVFEVWLNGQLEGQKTAMNWLGSFSAYGLNAVYLENYWNAGSPKAQERYFDNLVVSTSRIGC